MRFRLSYERITQTDELVAVLIVLNVVLADPNAGLIAGVVQLEAFEHFEGNLGFRLLECHNQ